MPNSSQASEIPLPGAISPPNSPPRGFRPAMYFHGSPNNWSSIMPLTPTRLALDQVDFVAHCQQLEADNTSIHPGAHRNGAGEHLLRGFLLVGSFLPGHRRLAAGLCNGEGPSCREEEQAGQRSELQARHARWHHVCLPRDPPGDREGRSERRGIVRSAESNMCYRELHQSLSADDSTLLCGGRWGNFGHGMPCPYISRPPTDQ